jgi:hypothetical protein
VRRFSTCTHVWIITNLPGLPTQIVQHDYDPAGNRTRLTYPDGVYVDYVYDELNRLKILRDDHAVDQVTYVYDELSRIHTMLRASGVLSTFAYDRASRVKTISHARRRAKSTSSELPRDPICVREVNPRRTRP